MGSPDPNQTFNQLVGNINGGSEVLKQIQEYGNGDPKAAMINYAAAHGKTALAQQIIQSMHLG